MACPFFRPTGRLEDGAWLSPPRLPLGDPCVGVCTAQGTPFEPPPPLLRDTCNTGYARGRCARFPADAGADAVRFSIRTGQDGAVNLVFILERDYAPLRHGVLEFDTAEDRFRTGEADECLMEQARQFVRCYLNRKCKV